MFHKLHGNVGLETGVVLEDCFSQGVITGPSCSAGLGAGVWDPGEFSQESLLDSAPLPSMKGAP